MVRATTTDQEFISYINHFENTENIQLIWCDALSVNKVNIMNAEHDTDVQYTRETLSGIMPSVLFFESTEQCIDHIKSTDNNNIKILLVISGLYASEVLSVIHNYRPLSFVFIFCKFPDNYRTLLTQYNKIVAIYTEQEKLRVAIVEKINLLEQQALQFIVFNRRQKSFKSVKENPLEKVIFVYHSVLLNVLKEMSPDECAKQHLISTCKEYYCNSKHDLKKIKEFRKTFKPEDAIKWYTKDCFLYRLLNRALRTEDVDLLFAFRFYIIVLCNALANEKQKSSFNTKFKLFRGQKMTMNELESLKKCIDNVITTNSFLSTSLNVNVALIFAGEKGSDSKSDCIVLFEIHVDPSIESVIYAPIDSGEEQEILFSLGTEFKIESIYFDNQKQLWTIELITISSEAQRIDEFVESTRTEVKDFYTPLPYYGHIIWHEFQQMDKGEAYFRNLIEKLPTDHPEFSLIYYELGCLYQKKENWSKALQCLKSAKEILYALGKQESQLMMMVWHTTGVIYTSADGIKEIFIWLQQALALWNLDNKDLTKIETLEYTNQVYERENFKDYQDIILDNYKKAVFIYKDISSSKINNKMKNTIQSAHDIYDNIHEFVCAPDCDKQATLPQVNISNEYNNEFRCNLIELIQKLKMQINEFRSEQTLQPAFMLLNEIMNTRIRAICETKDHSNMMDTNKESMNNLYENTYTTVKTTCYELILSNLELNKDSSDLLSTIFDSMEIVYSVYEKNNDDDNLFKFLEKILDIQQQPYSSSDNISAVDTLAQVVFNKNLPSAIVHCVNQVVDSVDNIEEPIDILEVAVNTAKSFFDQLMSRN